jgi:hypothetical protein
MIVINTVCPKCQHHKVRTIQVWQDDKWQWLNGCNNCDWEKIVGDVEDG